MEKNIPKVSVNLSTNLETVKFNSILVIEDDLAGLHGTVGKLIHYNYADTIYAEGFASSALDFLRTTKEIPPLILVDYLMEEMNGLQFLDKFALLPKLVTEHSKIVVMSAMVAYYKEQLAIVKSSKYVIGVLSRPISIPKLTELLINCGIIKK